MDIKIQLQDVKNASRSLLGISDKIISDLLCALADETVMQADVILNANKQRCSVCFVEHQGNALCQEDDAEEKDDHP